ncbi:MAG TPA: CHAD domain-containing protein [Dehalococcoidia bacterium]|nr:CHAD domain-containing protein [Dehalococcoidia bacterium]
METEAKFSFRDAAAFEAWLGRSRLGPFSLNRPRSVSVVDVYLDGEDFACLRGGYACRIRRQGGGLTATLKSLGDRGPAPAAGVRRRDEFEVELAVSDGASAGAAPATIDLPQWLQPEAWPGSAARTLALRLLAGARLRPIASVRQERHERDICEGTRRLATLSLDRVEFDRGQPAMFELEAELTPEGSEADLGAIVASLRSTAEFTSQARSKLERALAGVPGVPALDRADDRRDQRTVAIARTLTAAIDRPDFAIDRHERLLTAILEIRAQARSSRPDDAARAARDLAAVAPPPGLDAHEHGVLVAALALLSLTRDDRGRRRARRQLLAVAGADPSVSALGAMPRRRALALAALTAAAEALAEREGRGGRLSAVTSTERTTLLKLQSPVVGEIAHGAERGAATLWRAAFGRRLRFRASGEPPRGVGLRFDATLAASGRSLLAAQLARLRGFEAALRADPSEDQIHDARVAVRRLRTLLRVFRRAYTRRDVRAIDGGAKRLGDALGAVRELDVLSKALSAQAARQHRREGLDDLLAVWRAEREERRAELAAHVCGAEHVAWQQRITAFLADTAAGERGARLLFQAAPAQLWRSYGAVRAAGRDVSDLTLDELHELRKVVRRLRYLLEALREVLGSDAEGTIAAAVAVQDVLGELHDADVLNRRLRERLEGAARANSGNLPAGLVAVSAGIASELAARRRAFEEVWPALASRRYRRRLGRAVAAV